MKGFRYLIGILTGIDMVLTFYAITQNEKFYTFIGLIVMLGSAIIIKIDLGKD